MSEQVQERADVRTIYVCPRCNGGTALTPGGSEGCECPDGLDDYPPMDKPVRVIPLATLTQLAEEFEERATEVENLVSTLLSEIAFANQAMGLRQAATLLRQAASPPDQPYIGEEAG